MDPTSPQAHESQSTKLIIALAIIILITFITFLLRIYTRLCLLRSTGAEDYCIAAAMVSPALLSPFSLP